MILEYAIVLVVTLLAGAWSIPIGLLLGLPPAGVYVAAVIGSVTFSTVVLSVGGRARDMAVARWLPGFEDRVRNGRAFHIFNRWGTHGLAVIGGVLLGPSVTLAAALILDVPRPTFRRWYLGSTIVGFGLLTFLWQLVI